MSEFDPYLKWLGIRDSARPLNHYRLLGLELYESDKDVISMAADRQMTHIRTYQGGPNGKLSQQILNELARARRCLLVDEKKLAYDQQLQAKLAAAAGGAVAAPGVVPPQAAAPLQAAPPQVAAQPTAAEPTGMKLDVQADPDARQKTKSREKKELMWGIFSWISGGLAAVGVSAFLINSGVLERLRGGEPPAPVAPVVVNPENGNLPNNDNPINDNPLNDNPINNNKLTDDPVDDPGKDPLDPTNNFVSDVPENELGFELPVNWTIEDLDRYPKKINDEEGLLLRSIGSNILNKRYEKLGSSAPSTAGTNGVEEITTGLQKKGILIGVEYAVDSKLRIEKLRPIFRGRKSIVLGGLADPKSLLARPGYAVGEVEVSVLSPINCFRLRYMRILSDRLDSDDSYFSPWIGREMGPVRTIKNPLGAPIVAMYRDFGSDQMTRTVGLIAADRSMSWSEVSLPTPPTPSTPSAPAPKPPTRRVGKELPVVSAQPVASNFFSSSSFTETIMFVNELDEPVVVYGIDEQLKEKRYFEISPGLWRNQPSPFGGSWHVKKGNIGIATYRADRGRNTAVIDGRDPDIGGRRELSSLGDIEKVEKPSPSERGAAFKEIKKVYGVIVSEARARDAEKNRGLVKSMLGDARDSGDDPAMQFMIFQTAKDVALAQGDCEMAMSALRELDRRFIDFEFWDEAFDAVADSGRSLGRTGDKVMAHELEMILRTLIDEAVQSGESKSAGRLVTYAMKAASRNGDALGVEFYKSKDKEVDEIAKLQKQYESAAKRLKIDPENANANTLKGRYSIVVKDDFKAAIDCWKFSSDEKLLKIVKEETSGSADPVSLARSWRQLGQDPSTLFGRRCYERGIEVLQAAGKIKEAQELRELLGQ